MTTQEGEGFGSPHPQNLLTRKSAAHPESWETGKLPPDSNPLVRFSLAGEGNSLEQKAIKLTPLLGQLSLSGELSVWYAPPNTGKTLILLHLVIEAVQGKRIEGSSVFYVNADDSMSGVAGKVQILDDFGIHTLANRRRRRYASPKQQSAPRVDADAVTALCGIQRPFLPQGVLDVPAVHQPGGARAGSDRLGRYQLLRPNGDTLEVRPGGNKTYALRYWDEHGRQRQVKIGNFADITFAAAAKKAGQLRSQVTLGGSPAAEKKERKAIPTYADLAKDHMDHAKGYLRKNSYDGLEIVMRIHLLPRWGKLRLTEIKQQDVAKWLGELREKGLKPATVEKIRVTFHRSFELAARWNTPGGQTNPLRGLPKPKFNNARDRYLSAEEAERLHRAVAASPNPQLKFIVGLLLLTGARKRELLDAKWEHIDLARRTWHIPDSKTGKARYVPLSKQAIALIEQLPKFDKCPWLLANPKTRRPYMDIKRVWDTARDEAGLPGLRIHDLRHSAASFMINSGIDLFAVGRILGHGDHQSTMRYSHLANDTLFAAVEAGAAGLKVVWAEQATT